MNKHYSYNQRSENNPNANQQMMANQNVVYPCNGLLFIHKKEWIAQCFRQHATTMMKTRKHCAKWKQPDTKGQILYDSTHEMAEEENP